VTHAHEPPEAMYEHRLLASVTEKLRAIGSLRAQRPKPSRLKPGGQPGPGSGRSGATWVSSPSGPGGTGLAIR
jgi:hypothetical protein